MVYDDLVDRNITATQFTNIDSYLSDIRNRIRQKHGAVRQEKAAIANGHSIIELQREVNLLRKQRHDLEVRLRHHRRIIQSDKKLSDFSSIATSDKLREENIALAQANAAKERQLHVLHQQVESNARQNRNLAFQSRQIAELTHQVATLTSELNHERAYRQQVEHRSASASTASRPSSSQDDKWGLDSQARQKATEQYEAEKHALAEKYDRLLKQSRAQYELAQERQQQQERQVELLRQELKQVRIEASAEVSRAKDKMLAAQKEAREAQAEAHLAQEEARLAQEEARAAQEARASDSAKQVSGSRSIEVSAVNRIQDAVVEQHVGANRADVGRLGTELYQSTESLRKMQQSIKSDLEVMKQAFFSDELLAHVLNHLESLSSSSTTTRTRASRAADRRTKEELRKLKEQLQRSEEAARVALEEMDGMQGRHEHELRIAQIEGRGQAKLWKQRWQEEFDKRKEVTNKLLELKGNIRVFCRVRPLISKEAPSDGMAVVAKSQEVISVETGGVEKEFEYDRVFGPDSSQADVFGEVSLLIDNVLDGYNCCIIAYGQTGSGKTYTMEGVGDGDGAGVNTRALAELFRLVEERRERVGDVEVLGSMLEIYNEQLFDLLGQHKSNKGLDIKENKDGMYVPDLAQVPLTNVADVKAMVSQGKLNRSTFATSMNEHSSRSHLLLQVLMSVTDKTTNERRTSKLYLVDLAGSERISRSGAQGSRLKEAQAINSSLSALGDVINSLQQRKAHTPYRNSKLTRLLQDSLGGNAKTALFVNVSPAQVNAAESRISLEFAARAKKVELGQARRQERSPVPLEKKGTWGREQARMYRDTDVSSSSTNSLK